MTRKYSSSGANPSPELILSAQNSTPERLLVDRADVTDATLIVVSFTLTVADITDVLPADERPAHLVHVALTPNTVTNPTIPADLPYPVDSRRVSPADLTGLSIVLSKTVDATDEDVVLIFDSLTVLLQYVDVKTVFRFLHVTMNRLAAQGVREYFHLAPRACDEQSVSVLKSLFREVSDVADRAVDGERVPAK